MPIGHNDSLRPNAEEMMISYVDFSYDKPVGSSDQAKPEEQPKDAASK